MKLHFHMVKPLVCGFFTFCAAANIQAASISFDDQTVSVPGTYGFSGKGDGFVNDALKYATKIHGHTYVIKNRYVCDSENKERKKHTKHKKQACDDLPNSTTVALTNYNNDNNPTDGAYPPGVVGWSFDGTTVTNPTYTFTVWAGGILFFPDEATYSIMIIVDGRTYGPVYTNVNSNWDPTYFNKVPFNKNSRIQVIIEPEFERSALE